MPRLPFLAKIAKIFNSSEIDVIYKVDEIATIGEIATIATILKICPFPNSWLFETIGLKTSEQLVFKRFVTSIGKVLKLV